MMSSQGAAPYCRHVTFSSTLQHRPHGGPGMMPSAASGRECRIMQNHVSSHSASRPPGPVCESLTAADRMWDINAIATDSRPPASSQLDSLQRACITSDSEEDRMKALVQTVQALVHLRSPAAITSDNLRPSTGLIAGMKASSSASTCYEKFMSSAGKDMSVDSLHALIAGSKPTGDLTVTRQAQHRATQRTKRPKNLQDIVKSLAHDDENVR